MEAIMTKKGCIFCDIEDKHILENQLAYVKFDGYPVTRLHMLIIPKVHYDNYFDMPLDVQLACNQLVNKTKVYQQEKDKTITGFNVGFNCGVSAGQSIMHTHIHIIPRRDGDMKKPKGGVRHVIPEKGNY